MNCVSLVGQALTQAVLKILGNHDFGDYGMFESLDFGTLEFEIPFTMRLG